MSNNNLPENTDYKFIAKKALINWSILLLLLFIGGIFIYTFNIFLLFFTGLLIAILIIGLTKKLERGTGWRNWICKVLAIIIIFGSLGILLWVIGSTLRSQFNEFYDKIPEMIAKAKSYLKETSFGEKMWNTLQQNGESIKISSITTRFFKSTFGITGDIYAVLFLGIFLAVTPREYFKGFVTMFPKNVKNRASELLKSIYTNMKTWLKSQLLEMVIMFVLTSIGLLILGVDLWLVLAIITALFCFIPNIGPILALIPMILVSLLDSPQLALWVFITFMIIQIVETGAIGPYIRKKMLSLPPALVLFFQLVLGSLTGMWGILVATPLLLVIIIIVKNVYLNDEDREALADGELTN